ncbi:rhamnogalacturonan acetylesterase [Sphingomonas sp. Leaf25]|uniref:rhamnogalacturonan acetylesterase n=1 Tax=Sphingomonas sp. Leaf25 TaxID=1735692 RepID=UPI0006F2B7E1|nr:rhamnogalacturonan acetylesterase [Sphingomonas sp. Leaf25]KQN06486.1 lysophospholipase [Sphingomonas sp. Leaf25]
MLALLIAAALTAGQVAPAAAPPVVPIRASKVILVGDSTTAVSGGWGGSFCAEHVASFLACVNLARGGRSSGSYRAEGSWALALSEMRTPGFVRTWVVIQFGHNDQPGKPGRSTDLATEFPANLRAYVTETRAAGAVPVLVTPLSRRIYKDGRIDNDLAPWADAVRRVAREMRVPLIDLNALTLAELNGNGERWAERFAQLPPTAAPPVAATTETNDTPFAQRKLSFDRTHLGRAGADHVAALMAGALARAVPEMRPMLYPTQPALLPLR